MPAYNKSIILKLLATKEFRELSIDQKVFKLVTDYHVPYRCIENLFGIKKSSVERLVKAIREGRAPRTPGRPKVLKPDEEGQLVKALDDADAKQKPLGFQQFQNTVCLGFRDFMYHFSFINSTHHSLILSLRPRIFL